MSGGWDKPMEEHEAGADAGITVGEWMEQMRARVRPAAERVGIEVNSIIMWPMCAMSPFIEACERLERIRRAFQALRDGEENANSKLYRALMAEFPPPQSAKGAVKP